MERRKRTRKAIGLAKLTPPSLPVVLKRPRLFRLLDKARTRPVTWVAAPAGSGKTTLVASYLKARRLPVLWYRLDESDADPSSFFHFLSLGAKSLAPRVRTPLPVLTPEYALGLPTFARRFVQELCTRLPRRCVIVLDNYHEVPDQSLLHQLLPHAFQEVPVPITVIGISRYDPPPTMVALQARHAMAFIGSEPMSFSKAEAAAVVRLHLPPREGPARRLLISKMYERVGGWAAGLMLMLEQLKHNSAKDFEQVRETPETLFQYMATEIMEQLDPDVQKLLLKTSLLSDISVGLASKLTNLSNAGEILSSLHRSRYFTERREGTESSYRYHPLFREFLLTQLVRKYEPPDVQRLRQLAAGFLAEAGCQEEAISMLRDAEDWRAMSRQIIALAPTMLGQGRLATVDGWISSIPPMITREHTWLRFWQGCCRLFMNPSEAHTIFEEVFEQFVAESDQAGALLAWTNIVRGILFQWKGLPRLDPWIDRFASLQPEGASYPTEEIEAHVAEAMAGALVWRRPANPQTREWLERAITLNDRLTGSGAGHAIFLTESYLAWLGDLDGVRKGNDRLWEEASKPGAALSKKIVYYLSESMLAWLEGRVEDCRMAVREGLSLGEREGIHLWDGWLIFQGIHNDLLSGELNAAREQLNKVKCGPLEGLYFSQYCYHTAWYMMLEGDVQKALRMIEQGVESSVQDGGLFPEALCCLLAASISQMLGDRQKAETYRLRTDTISEAMGSNLLTYGTLLLAAQFALDAGDRVKGLQSLRSAFALGRKHNITEYPGWHAQAIARLCAIALEEGIEVAYVQDLIRKRWLPLAPELRPAVWPSRVKIRTFGKLTVEVDGKPLEKQRKVPHRLLELLVAIITFGSYDVPVSRLIDALWPDADGDTAHENVKKSIARLRKLLAVDDVILWQDGKISLNRDHCWIDTLAFEHQAKRTELSPASVDDAIRMRARALAVYTGPFLGLDEIPEWARPYQSNLRNQWIRLVMHRTDQESQETDIQEGAKVLETAIGIDPVAEPLYQRLIPLLREQGRQAEAGSYYDRCRDALARWAGRMPSVELERLTTPMRHAGGDA